ncbi:MAG: hypothetical protein CMP24_00565 [Rickettsiales bacterium]|nr:hypothetical protein [Rickettsiales bacterium]|tara:strand:- start:274 stop:801 length:528 start_codon:yes stop_codon:yes gene_type:complete
MFRFLVITLISSICFNSHATDFEKANEVIELRKSAMQGIWMRVKRLAPFIEFNEDIEYGPEIAKQDAKEIKILLSKTKNLWPDISNLSTKNLTNATPAIWVLPEYFDKLYNQAETSAMMLEESLNKDNLEAMDLAMCNLGNACGTCHAAFRRLLTSQLANEASAWSGRYIKNCKN